MNQSIVYLEKPMPHVIIDNFLPEEDFRDLREQLNNLDNTKKTHADWNTSIENKKTTHTIEELEKFKINPIEIMAGTNLIKIISDYMGFNEIVPLTNFSDFGGVAYYHKMQPGAHLGSHVDHSSIAKGHVHVANAIYYVHEKWTIGGETTFYDFGGLALRTQIEPKPNRMVIFLHDSQAFHGVKRVFEPRESFYMGYFIRSEIFENQALNCFNKTGYHGKWFRHGVAFVPFFPDGLRSFQFRSFREKELFRYLRVYAGYWRNRLFKNNYKLI